MAKLNAEEIKFWLEEIKSCEDRQLKELKQRNNYPWLINYYEGRLKLNPMHPHVAMHEFASVINDYFPSINSLISEIMYQNPDIMVDAAKPTATITDRLTGQPAVINVEAQAPLMKSAIVYGQDKTEMLVENRVALFDMITAGFCAVEVNHIVERDEVPNLPNEEQMKKRVPLVQKMVNALSKPKTTEEAEEKLEAQGDDKQAFNTNEKTYVKRWSPLDILFDWKAERFKDSRYIIKKIGMSKAEFDVKYPDFKDKVAVGAENIPYAQHLQERHTKRVIVYEIQIQKKENEYWTLILTPTLKSEELDFFKRPYTTNGFNLKIGTLHKYGKIYPIALAQINKKMADELNEYIFHKKEVAERNVPKHVVLTTLKEGAREALRSTKVNDLVDVEGGTTIGKITPLTPTKVAPDNDELVGLFQLRSEKGWGISATRQQGVSGAKFATEIQIQEAGFQEKTIDLQEGLRQLIKEELDTLKDIIITFWDDPVFLKITGKPKPLWYEPKIDKLTGNVLNPLSDLLTGDYFIKVDISSALRPNLEKKKNDNILLLQQLISPPMQGLLLQKNKTLDLNFINKIVRDFGLDPETVFADITPEEMAILQRAAQAEAA